MEEKKRTRTTGNLRAALRVSLLFIILAEVAVVHFLHLGHPYFWFENIPGFSSLYGLLSCVALILVSKWLGKRFLSRPEDHYD